MGTSFGSPDNSKLSGAEQEGMRVSGWKNEVGKCWEQQERVTAMGWCLLTVGKGGGTMTVKICCPTFQEPPRSPTQDKSPPCQPAQSAEGHVQLNHLSQDLWFQ